MTSRARVQQHRTRMRAQGMRLVQTWVPDLRGEAALAEARRQAERIAATTSDDQDFVEAIALDWQES